MAHHLELWLEFNSEFTLGQRAREAGWIERSDQFVVVGAPSAAVAKQQATKKRPGPVIVGHTVEIE